MMHIELNAHMRLLLAMAFFCVSVCVGACVISILCWTRLSDTCRPICRKYTQGRSDGGVYRYIYPPKISPPKIFMRYSSSYKAEHQLATAS